MAALNDALEYMAPLVAILDVAVEEEEPNKGKGETRVNCRVKYIQGGTMSVETLGERRKEDSSQAQDFETIQYPFIPCTSLI